MAGNFIGTVMKYKIKLPTSAAAPKTGVFLRFLAYVKPYWKLILLGTIGGIVKFTVPLLTPQITRYLLDDVLLSTAMPVAQKIHLLMEMVGGMLALYIFVWTPWTYVRHYYTQKAGQKSVFDLRCDLYDHILQMSASFFDRHRSGSIVSRLINDINLAQNLVGSALTNVWMDAISLVVILYFLFKIDVASTLVALATFPLYILVVKLLGRQLRESTHAVQAKISHISGTLQEKVAGSVIVHAFTQEKKEERDFLVESNELFSMTMRQGHLQSLNVTLNGLLVSVAPLIVTIYCGFRVIQGTLTIGDMVAVGLYLSPLYLPIQRFAELNVILANSLAALDRIFAILDQQPEIHNAPGAIELVDARGRVEFDHVCFTYPPSRDEDADAEPGSAGAGAKIETSAKASAKASAKTSASMPTAETGTGLYGHGPFTAPNPHGNSSQAAYGLGLLAPSGPDYPPQNGTPDGMEAFAPAQRHSAFNVAETCAVLSDISFTADTGQRIALVGPSGSGKSTLVSLIPRFYDVDSGTIRVDGHDVRDLTVKSLRRQVGMVLQDSILFSGNVLENIRYGNPEASEEEILAACQAANALEFIQALPNGFNTEVGEGGNFLSGGQKQRITIARAFLRNPRILILDEATAALDAEAESLIKEALAKLMVGRTTLIIAHRLSTVVNADQILVLADGQILERGSHLQLLALGGLYHRLYTQQFESAGVSANLLQSL
jgi:ABC-type multidrug transport system fused ATPase/permease subunit